MDATRHLEMEVLKHRQDGATAETVEASSHSLRVALQMISTPSGP